MHLFRDMCVAVPTLLRICDLAKENLITSLNGLQAKANQCRKYLINYPIHIYYPATDTIIAWHPLPLCIALPTDYQRIYMRCITSLQRPKTQRIVKPLVNILATPICAFRYRCIRCCRWGSVVVEVSITPPD
jgi:hypothetical protein